MRHGKSYPYYRCRGFTLLEVLVAFVILALSLGVIYQLFGQGTRAASQSARYTQATMIAQSLLAEAGVTHRLEASQRSGFSGDYHWEVITQQYDDMLPPGYLVTTPLRTLIDVAGSALSQEYLDAAVKEALERGLVRRSVLGSVRCEPAARRRLDRALAFSGQGETKS